MPAAASAVAASEEAASAAVTDLATNVSSITEQAKQQMESLMGDMGDLIKTSTDSMGDILTTGKNTLSETIANLVRKIISTSATTLSIGVAGVLGYAIYRSYIAEHGGGGSGLNSHNASLHERLLSNFQEPDIGHAQRTKEEVEEVNILNMTS
jgi:hypothetical protein